jgi:tetratricopeptide (TPR) repeat protein
VSEYYVWAESILAGKWLWDKLPLHAPLYPFMLATILSVTGKAYFAARALQLAIGICSMLFVSLAARKRFGDHVALCVAFVWSLYFPLIYYESQFYAESLQVLLHSAVLAWLIGRPPRRGWEFAGIGLLLGLSIITHPKALLAAAMIISYLAWRAWADRPALASLTLPLIAAAAAILPIVPVSVHNSRLAGEFILVQRNEGLNFYIGNNPNADGTPNVRIGPDWDALKTMPRLKAGKRSEGDRRRFYYAESFAFMRDQPIRFAGLIGRKLLLTLNTRDITGSAPPAALQPHLWLVRTIHIWFGLAIGLAAVGTMRYGRQCTPALLMIAACTIGSVVFTVSGRYRLEMMPAVLLLAGLGLSALLRTRWSAATRREWLPAVAIAAAAVAVSWLPVTPARDNSPAEGAILRAQALRFKGRPADAIVELQSAVSLQPTLARPHYLLALAKLEARDDEGVDPLFGRAIELAPAWTEALIDYAEYLNARGRYEEARSIAERGIRLDPEHPDLRMQNARALHELGRVRQAIAEYAIGHPMRQSAADYCFFYSSSLARAGDFAGAIRVLRPAAAANPQATALHLRLARLLAAAPDAEIRNPPEASALAQRAIESARASSSPPTAEMFDVLAIALAANGEFARAVEQAGRAVQLAESSGQVEAARVIRGRKSLYENGRAYVEPRPPPVRED